MDYQTGHVMTLANSIIGVSVLAMPYCFKQCGIVLSILMLLISSIISRLACHFLVKSAIMARRKTFEFLAFYIFGAMGKFAIEIGIIGFLIGTCIAFFVVMGDLGPEIISEMTGSYTTNTMRTSILMALALFCVLPLGLLRNVDSLNGVSKATIGFYCCLVLKIVVEGIPHIFSGDWYHSVNFWRPAGILQCLPIFTMALFCQTQLFEIYQALQNATLEKMNNLVRVAVNICTCVYIFVGVFGYIAFFQKPFTGNILLSFSPSLMTDVIKIGFILSVAFSFPLVIFPCRASLYSLIYKEGYPLHEGMSTYIPEGRFKGLTLFIVFISLIIGIMIPNIELVLGLVGSTIGVMICVLFPVTCFICIFPKNTNERILAQLMLMIGVFVMVLGTYKNLYSLEALQPNTVTIKNLDQLDLNVVKAVDKIQIEKVNVVEKVPTTIKTLNIESKNVIEKVTTMKIILNEELKEIRHEPPQPIEPIEETEEKHVPDKDEAPPKVVSIVPLEEKQPEEKSPPETAKLSDIVEKSANESKNDEVDIEAIKKEDKEVEQQEKEELKKEDTKQALIDSLRKQNEVQEQIVEQHKKLNEEKVKAMKEIESIARQAIEKISGGKDDAKIVADVAKQISENVNVNIENKEENEEKNVENKLDIGIKKDGETKNEANLENKNDIEKLVPESDSIVNVKVEKENIETKDSKIEKDDVSEQKNIPKDVNEINKKPESAPIVAQPDLVQINNQETNIKTQKEINKSSENKIVKQNFVPLKLPKQNNTSDNNINNTAPLFLALGKSDVKSEENNVQKLVPLPLAVSANLINKSDSLNEGLQKNPDSLSEHKAEMDEKEDAKMLRRDILSVKRKR